MNTAFFITTNRGHLLAYHRNENDTLSLIEDNSFDEGTSKISEIVTDQAGAFPVSGTPGTGSYESLPLKAELEVRCFRQIAEAISRLLSEHQPGWWALAAPSEINGAILDHLTPEARSKISVNLKRDLTNTPVGQLLGHFEKAAAQLPTTVH